MEVKRGVTLKDIARAVGTTVSTVSRALNGKPGVSPALRSRILEVARELGYIPHAPARSLALRKTEAIGFLIHRRQSLSPRSFYGTIMAGAEAAAAEAGYHLIFSTTDATKIPEALEAGRVDGLLLAGCDFDADFIAGIRRRGIPIVLVDNRMEPLEVDSVVADNRGGAFTAASHLIALGHRRLGFIAETFANLSFAERLEGFRRALEANGLEIREEWMVTGEPEGEEPVDITFYGWKAMTKLLSLSERPTAVMAANDAAAVGAMKAIREAGLRVPDDIAVVGFDDAPWAAHVDPPLTTVWVPRRELGQVAARRLLELLGGYSGPAMEIKLATTLVVRRSCGARRTKGGGRRRGNGGN